MNFPFCMFNIVDNCFHMLWCTIRYHDTNKNLYVFTHLRAEGKCIPIYQMSVSDKEINVYWISCLNILTANLNGEVNMEVIQYVLLTMPLSCALWSEFWQGSLFLSIYFSVGVDDLFISLFIVKYVVLMSLWFFFYITYLLSWGILVLTWAIKWILFVITTDLWA